MLGLSRESIKQFFRRLGHCGYGCTEVRVLTPGKKRTKGIGFFDNADDFLSACLKWNGKANIYAGRNPRPKRFMQKARNEIKKLRKGATKEDIEVITAVAIDIDPIRPDPKQPSTDGELVVSLEIARRLAEVYKNASVDCTGNGACIWLPVEPMKVVDSLEEKLKQFERDLRNALTESERAVVKVDSIFDLPRINKVIGTMSVKGRHTIERPHRLTYFVDGPYFDTVDGLKDKILKLGIHNKEKPRRAKQKPRATTQCFGSVSTLAKEQETEIVNAMPPVVKQLWENGYPRDRSAGLTSLLQYFLSRGHSKEEAVSLVMVADARWGKFTNQNRRDAGWQYMLRAADDILQWADKHDYGVVKPPYRKLNSMFP